MDRIFHAKIKWYQYLYLVLLGGITFYLMWVMLIIPALIFALLLVFMIERFIHTTYTVTKDNHLVISHGRFSKNRSVSLSDIITIEKRNSVKVSNLYFTEYLLIGLVGNRYLAVWPMKEREFLRMVEARRNNPES